MNEYLKQAELFAEKHGVTLKVLRCTRGLYFPDDKQTRYIFKLKLTRNRKQYTFTFGQSIANGSKEPALYDIFACLTKSDPGSFENFCSEYGYDTDSRKAEKTYKNVCKEWEGVNRLFGDIIDELSEIQ